jgi:ATP-dependent Clp protease protease subunit
MENAVIKIYGDIGEEGITSSFVSDFLDQNKDAKNIFVKINSRGGDVSEGWAIHDLLVNSGKKITTIGESKVYSIATIIFLAGSEREMLPNSDGLIHNPYIPGDNMNGDYRSSDLLSMAESMAQEEEKILDFYAKRTGSPKDKLAEYMSKDTKLSAEDMLSLGFATKITEPIKAFAIYKPKNNFTMDENEVKSFGQKIDAILDKVKGLSRVEPTDQVVTDKDGKKLTLTKVGDPAVGDAATPDGSYALANGNVITVSGGKITEIKPAVAAKSDLEIANEKIADLEKQLDAEKTKVIDSEKIKVAAEAEKTAAKEEKEKAVALVTELQGLKNSWKPESRSKFSSAEKVGDVDLNKVREIMKNKNN